MSENPTLPVPAALPILGAGRHRDQSRGACFMEYTSVLAGEAFSDSPPCVDAELAAVLRGANDILSDQARAQLVPLLGRAIGLVVRRPDGRPAARLPRFRRRPDADGTDLLVTRLRLSVSDRLIDGVGGTASRSRGTRSGRHIRLSRLFWELMTEPETVTNSSQYIERLVTRLELLHRCYEDAMTELGVPRATEVPAATTPACLPDATSNPVAS